jgi:integrase
MLNRAEIPERIAYARTPRKLPTILSADEVVRVLEAVPSLKARAALTTAYAAGLRPSEAVSLSVGDIDSARMLIEVRHDKGCQGPNPHALAATSWYPAAILAPCATDGLAVSWARRRAGRRAGAPFRLPVRD